MTTRGLPFSTRRALQGVTPRISASAASDRGRRLLASQEAMRRFRQHELQSPGYNPNDAGLYRDFESYQGRTYPGYFDPATARDPRLGYLFPQTDSQTYQGFTPDRPAPEPVDVGNFYAQRDGSGYLDAAARMGEDRLRQTSQGTRDTGSMVSSAIDALLNQAQEMKVARDEALANAEGEVAEQYNHEIEKIVGRVAELQGNLEQFKGMAADTDRKVSARYGDAIAAAEQVQDIGQPMIAGNNQEAQANIAEGFDSASGRVSELMAKIGADPASMGAVDGIVRELEGLASETSADSGEHAQAILEAAERVAVTAAQQGKASFRHDLGQMQADFADAIKDSVKGLMENKADLERSKAKAIEGARSQVMDAFSDKMQSFTGPQDYADQVTNRAMDDYFASSNVLDARDRAAVEGLFEELNAQGIRTGAQVQQYFNARLSEEGVSPFASKYLDAVSTMFDIYDAGFQSWEGGDFLSNVPTPTSGKVVNRDGKTVFTRNVGEAPNNKANVQHPTYQARANFVTGQRNYVLSNFNVSDSGQWRDLDAEVTGDRSDNSDHYSGGAFDVSGDPAEIRKVFEWAMQQPWVSFAQVYPDGTLLHLSADIGHFHGDGHDHSAGASPAGGGAGGGNVLIN